MKRHAVDSIIAGKAYDIYTGYNFIDEKTRDFAKRRSTKRTQMLL